MDSLVRLLGVDQPRLLEFLKASARLLMQILLPASSHENRAAEWSSTGDRFFGRQAYWRMRFFHIPKALQTSIPDVFWGTVFGTPYVEMFGPRYSPLRRMGRISFLINRFCCKCRRTLLIPYVTLLRSPTFGDGLNITWAKGPFLKRALRRTAAS